MAIRQSKYIDITSGVGGKSAVSNRELIARVFTTNALCGIGHVYEFDDADAVMAHFGADSNEYKFAAKYFGFVSKSVSNAKKISFFRWAQTASAPYILATKAADTTLSKYVDGNVILRIGQTEYTIPVDFTTPASISDVCSAVASAISSFEVGSATPFSGTTCTIENSKVKLTLPATVTDTIYTLGDTLIGNLLGLTSGITSNNSAVETPAEAASRSDSISDNYGSFMFVGGTDLTTAEIKAVAEWNQTKNFKYLFCVGVLGFTKADGTLENQSAIEALVASSTGLGGISGTCVWCYKNTSDFITAFPAALFATTDYSRANTTKTFMYQQNDTIDAAITNDTSANILDPLFVNYIGVTQSAGGLIQFSQDGFNMDGVDTAVYCNEVWMKSSFWTAIMNLFLAVEKVPANDDGKGMIKAVMMDTITTGIKNGTIQPRKTLDIVQKAYIGQVLNDNNAWKDVYNNGYVLDIVIEKVNNKYVAKYLLVYSKGDAVRKVEGSDILI